MTAVIVSAALTAGALASAPAANAVTGVSSWSALQSAMTAGGDIQLLGSITGGGSQFLTEGSGVSVSLDLNGYTLSIPTPPTQRTAIQVPGTSSFTVRDTSSAGTGTLTAQGGWGSAGIGGRMYGGDVGPITILSGTVWAQGGQYGAGIGGGASSSVSSITISGGSVTALGTWDAAGIGSGDSGTVTGTISITGGTVSAQGNDYAAAIGGGAAGTGAVVVTIGSGATVTATGPFNAVGVGAFSSLPGSVTNEGTLILPAGTVQRAPSNWAFTNNGTLQNAGSITGSGTIANAGTILNTGTIDPATAITGHNYSVQLAPLAGTVSPTSLQVYADTLTAGSVVLPPATPTISGQVFMGWNTLADGSGATVSSSTSLSGIAGLSTGAAVVQTLSAIYNAVPVISTSSLPAGEVGTAYTAPIGTSAGSGITYSAGTLPPGLSLDPSTGQISGTPTTAGTSSVTVTATNSLGSDAHTYSITVAAAPVIPTAPAPTPSVPATPTPAPVSTTSPAVPAAPTTPTAPEVDPLRIAVARPTIGGRAALSGSTIAVSLSGLVVGEHYSVLIGRRTVASGIARASIVRRTVTVPADLGDALHRIRVTGSEHRTPAQAGTSAQATIRTARATKHLRLTVSPTPQVQANLPVRITVRGLYAGEPVTVTYAGERVSPKGAVATASGRYTVRVSAGWSWGWKAIHVHGVGTDRQQSAMIAVIARQ